MRRSYNPGARNASHAAAMALAGMSGTTNGMAYGMRGGPGLGEDKPSPFGEEPPILTPTVPGLPSISFPTPVITAPGATAPSGPGFDWQSLINQGFDFAKTIFLPAGTAIRTPQGTVVRQTQGAPIAYQLSQSDTNLNAGGALGVAGPTGMSTGALLALGAGAIVLMLVLRGGSSGGGRR